jgi:hypothetical protein
MHISMIYLNIGIGNISLMSFIDESYSKQASKTTLPHLAGYKSSHACHSRSRVSAKLTILNSMPNPTIILHKIQPHSILRKQGDTAGIAEPCAGGILDILLYLAIQRYVPLVVSLSVGLGE